jgi:cephalosporin hydroxylase
MEPNEIFKLECSTEVEAMGSNAELHLATKVWINAATKAKYSYHFEWLGRPIIQLPQDIVALQEIVWATKPSVIIETGVAHGGSLILSASLLALLDLVDGQHETSANSTRRVIGVDIDIRQHNRLAIQSHPLGSRINLLEASSTDPNLVSNIRSLLKPEDRVMVILDSNHTEKHVLEELKAYSDLVSEGCYLIVFDTVIENLPPDSFPNRDWGLGNNPWTATRKFLEVDKRFEHDKYFDDKLQITVAPGGFLKRTSK